MHSQCNEQPRGVLLSRYWHECIGNNGLRALYRGSSGHSGECVSAVMLAGLRALDGAAAGQTMHRCASSFSISRIRSRHFRSVRSKSCVFCHFRNDCERSLCCRFPERSLRVISGVRPRNEAGAVYVAPSLPQTTVLPGSARIRFRHF
jgi:hypothetical protein